MPDLPQQTLPGQIIETYPIASLFTDIIVLDSSEISILTCADDLAPPKYALELMNTARTSMPCS